MAKKNEVYVVWGNSESGDNYGPFVFSKKPSKSTMKQIALDCDSTEELDGPGDFGSYVYLRCEKVTVDERFGQ